MTEPSAELLELVEVVELVDVSFDRISAYRVSKESDEDSSDSFEIEPEFGLAFHEKDPGLGILLTFRAKTHRGNVEIDAFATYAVPEERRERLLNDNNVVDFANKVAIMTLVPYIRAAMSDITQRVFEESIVMPIIRRGDLAFPPPSQSEDDLRS